MNLYLFLLAILVYFLVVLCSRHIDNRNKVILLLLGGFILRLSAGLDNYLHDWDERYHALVSKNLMDRPLLPFLYKEALLHYDISDFTNNHVWLSKPPLPLWLASGSMKIFGVSEIAFRFPAILLSTLSVFVTYKTATILFGTRTALLAAFFHSVNGSIIEMAGARISSDVVETTFVFCVGMSMFYLVRVFNESKNIKIESFLCGVFTGFAFLSKWYPAGLTLMIFFVIILMSRKDRRWMIQALSCLLAGFLIISAPWCVYCFVVFPEEAAIMYASVLRPLSQTIQGHDGGPFYYLNQIRIMFGEMIYLPLLWFIYKSYRDFNRNHLILVLWFAIPLLIFSLSQTKRSNYLLVSAPAYFMISACFFYFLKNVNLSGFRRYLKLVMMGLIILLPVRYAIERIKPFREVNIDDNWKKALVAWDVAHKGKKVLFGYPNPIEAMFYTDAIVYSVIPDMNTLIGIQNKGYHVFVNNNETNGLEDEYVRWGMQIISIPPKGR